MVSKKERAAQHKRDAARRWRAANKETIAAKRKEYRAANAEKLNELNKAWRAAHPERTREINRLSEHRRRARARARVRRNEIARARRAADPEPERDRQRRFRAEHPDKMREYRRTYRERHPEQVALSSQQYRDRHAERVRAQQRAAATVRRMADPHAFKRWYQDNLEEQRARGREAARLRARLKALGLPPRHVERTYVADRRANDSAAQEFFARDRAITARAEIAREGFDPRDLHLPVNVAAVFRKISPPRTAQEYLRRASASRDAQRRTAQIAARARSQRKADERRAAFERLRTVHESRVASILADKPRMVSEYRARHEARLREEIRMDSVARMARGLGPYDVDDELIRRASEEITPTIRGRLVRERQRTLSRAEQLVQRYSEAAPHGGTHKVLYAPQRQLHR